MTKREGYLHYLATERWKAISEKVKRRDGNRCRVCNSEENLQAHHRTYVHKGDEENHMGDLTTLCGDCHNAFHEWRRNGGKIARKQAMVTLTESKIEVLRGKREGHNGRIERALGISPGFRWIDLAGEMMPLEQWERLAEWAKQRDSRSRA